MGQWSIVTTNTNNNTIAIHCRQHPDPHRTTIAAHHSLRL